ncbi:HP0268 family nuclease [Helicobacter cetorum]|uniref:nuclease n=1 Tax=Helicobacter cetorum TaxID=138563 RepID=UPI000CF11DB0|nr:HP0268 family nuclease [Helicobacter cetorum]
MKLALAKNTRKSEQKSVELEDLYKKFSEDKHSIFYFAPSNAHKDMLKAVDFFKEKGHMAYLDEIRVSTDEKDFLYELHII